MQVDDVDDVILNLNSALNGLEGNFPKLLSKILNLNQIEIYENIKKANIQQIHLTTLTSSECLGNSLIPSC